MNHRVRHIPLDEVQAAILVAARRLDVQHRLGGLVDLPRLRAALSYPRELLDRALVGLHRRGDEATLSVANAPSRLPDAGNAGIWMPWGDGGNACFYYLALQSAGKD